MFVYIARWKTVQFLTHWASTQMLMGLCFSEICRPVKGTAILWWLYVISTLPVCMLRDEARGRPESQPHSERPGERGWSLLLWSAESVFACPLHYSPDGCATPPSNLPSSPLTSLALMSAQTPAHSPLAKLSNFRAKVHFIDFLSQETDDVCRALLNSVSNTLVHNWMVERFWNRSWITPCGVSSDCFKQCFAMSSSD